MIVSGWGLIGTVWGIKGEIQVEGLGFLGLAVDKFDGFIRKQGVEVALIRYGFQTAKTLGRYPHVASLAEYKSRKPLGRGGSYPDS